MPAKKRISKIKPALVVSPSMAMRSLVLSSFMVQGIYAAAKLKLADHLSKGPLSIKKLAARTKTSEQHLARLVRALSCVGVFSVAGDGTISLTPLGETLSADAKDSLYHMVMTVGDSFYRQAWEGLTEAVKTGGNAFETVHGLKFFDFISERPQLSQSFNGWMVEVARIQCRAIIDAYDFSKIKHLIDIGGGYGALLTGILDAYPKLKGTVFDLPSVIERSPLQQDERFDGRLSLSAGDFFKSIPAGGDAYMMKYILHDWNDADAVRLLKNCRKILGPKTKLLVLDMIIPIGSGYHYSKLSDLNMMVLNHGGMERTRAEFDKLFRKAGLTISQVIPTDSELSIIEARRYES